MEFAGRLHIAWLITFSSFIFAPLVFAQGYKVGPVPHWVEPAKVPLGDQQERQNHSNGVAYLLLDNQWRVMAREQSRYRHLARQAINTSGLADVSRISIDFDPSYQSVVVHEILVHRAGRSADRFNRSQISLLQREKDLENQVYDGSKTLNIFIEDVRVGDIVEYSYSMDGVNPIFLGHFSTELDMRWPVPVERLNYRVLWESPRPLHISNRNTDIEPVVETSEGHQEYVWTRDRIESLVVDGNTPDWYDPYPTVQLSDVGNWNAVARWAWPLYQPVLDTPRLRRVAARLLEQATTPEQRVLAALHFVQEDVRYLGIEMGERSMRPNAPDAVIEQLFGDCKDKSRLLVSLLRGMGIEASSALVNTLNGAHLNGSQPRHTAFNHAIVMVQVNGKRYWLDPTRTHQSGGLDALYQPDYDYALVIAEDTNELVNMSKDIKVADGKVVNEKFDIRGAIDEPVDYEISTYHERYYADSMRRQLARFNPALLQNAYLNYTAKHYPEVRAASRVEFSNDEQLNRLSLTERYTIPAFWSASDDEAKVVAKFLPFLIRDHVVDVASPIRNAPYALSHPVRYRQTTRILVPKGWQFERKTIEVKDKAFRFSKKVDFDQDTLTIDYVYESLSDHVRPEDIKTYSKNIRTVRRYAYLQLQRRQPEVHAGRNGVDDDDRATALDYFFGTTGGMVSMANPNLLGNNR